MCAYQLLSIKVNYNPTKTKKIMTTQTTTSMADICGELWDNKTLMDHNITIKPFTYKQENYQFVVYCQIVTKHLNLSFLAVDSSE
jgi:hypothetical protein